VAHHNPSDPPFAFPVAPVDRRLAPLSRFLHIEAASGIVLLSCAAVAIALANSPLAAWFASVWKTPMSRSLGGVTVSGDTLQLDSADCPGDGCC
jgi:NhaA family Na+:H+ antiporter